MLAWVFVKELKAVYALLFSTLVPLRLFIDRSYFFHPQPIDDSSLAYTDLLALFLAFVILYSYH